MLILVNFFSKIVSKVSNGNTIQPDYLLQEKYNVKMTNRAKFFEGQLVQILGQQLPWKLFCSICS